MKHRALISGASIAGLSAAFWLSRAGWEVEVIERFPGFREGGQNVDIRGKAHEVIDLMGLTDEVRAATTTEDGTTYLGARGRRLGRIPADQESDGPTAELEILRGDLARILMESLDESVQLRFSERILKLDDRNEAVHVDFDSGRRGTYELIVIAEGVRSRTRDMVFGDDVHRTELGLNMIYGTIPRTASDDRSWRWYTAPGGRGATIRPDNKGTVRATLAYLDRQQNLEELPDSQAKAVLARRFRGAGWETGRIAQAFIGSPDVYIDYLTQIRMPSWHRGKIVVTGDAAWCVTPLGGGGTSLAIIGGYVLAAYADATDGAQRYEDWMRPLVNDVQNLPKGTPGLFYPQSRGGVMILRAVQALLASPPLRRIGARFAHVATTDQELPPAR